MHHVPITGALARQTSHGAIRSDLISQSEASVVIRCQISAYENNGLNIKKV